MSFEWEENEWDGLVYIKKVRHLKKEKISEVIKTHILHVLIILDVLNPLGYLYANISASLEWNSPLASKQSRENDQDFFRRGNKIRMWRLH